MRNTLVMMESIFADPGQISLKNLIARFEENSFLILIFILISPNLVPFLSQFGIAEFTSAMVCLLSLQMMVGKETPWLPKKVAEREMSSQKVYKVGAKIFPLLYKLELLTHPRLRILSNDKAHKFYGAMFFILAFLILLPLPFFNYAPAVVIALSVIGLLSEDGLLLLTGIVLFGAIMGGFAYTVLNFL